MVVYLINFNKFSMSPELNQIKHLNDSSTNSVGLVFYLENHYWVYNSVDS